MKVTTADEKVIVTSSSVVPVGARVELDVTTVVDFEVNDWDI